MTKSIMQKEKEAITVCVTGASGFIASHIIKILLEKGYSVRGTVRTLDNKNKTKHLKELSFSKERLKLFEANLLINNSFDEAVSGCDFVIHTASPYIINTKDPQKNLIDPALNGTHNIIKSCLKEESIKKLILTSSIAAITDNPLSNKIYNESDWNEESTLKRNPYFYSKKLAEKAAWDTIPKDCHFNLVTINPGLVLGPSLVPSLNNSNMAIVEMINGHYPFIMDLNWGIVDVRDVALAHILAFENKKTNGRYICINKCIDMKSFISHIDNSKVINPKLPKIVWKGTMKNFIIKILSYTQGPGKGSYLRSHIGKTIRIDNSKICQDFKINFTPFEKTINDTIDDLYKWKHLKIKP